IQENIQENGISKMKLQGRICTEGESMFCLQSTSAHSLLSSHDGRKNTKTVIIPEDPCPGK
ncbi:MAG: hypothetical protein D3908_05025, partial [Candidatus Electrothrix sp. AUS4]|nr:hypothetical protein [Candidatus Electrothrix sp. AUS4]